MFNEKILYLFDNCYESNFIIRNNFGTLRRFIIKNLQNRLKRYILLKKFKYYKYINLLLFP